MNAAHPGGLGGTYGGNPLACAAALAVIETIEKDDLLGNAVTIGERLRAGLADDRVTEIRGQGLLIGLDLSEDRSAQVTDAALARGFIINACSPNRIRLAPPLILTADQADEFLAAWPAILDAAYTDPGSAS
jgi:acetylornithine aminotransferase